MTRFALYVTYLSAKLKKSLCFVILSLFCISLIAICGVQTASAEWKDVVTLDQNVPNLSSECSYRLKFFQGITEQHFFPYAFKDKPISVSDDSAGTEQTLSFRLNPYQLLNIFCEEKEDLNAIKEELAELGEGKELALDVLGRGDTKYTPRYHSRFVAKIDYHYWSSPLTSLYGVALPRPERFTLQENCPSIAPSTPPEVISASASSSYSASYSIEKTLDNDRYTYWIGAYKAGSYTVEYQLNRVSSISQLEIDWYSTTYASSNFDVLVSEDGTDYTPVSVGLKDAGTVNLGGAKGKHIRIQIHSINNSYYPVIREVRVSAK